MMDAPNTLVDEDIGYIDQITRDFNAKLEQFERLVSWLRGKREVAASDPSLRYEYDALMSRANFLQGSIDSAKESINQLTNMVTNMTPSWWSSFFNDDDAMSGYTSSQMGFLPILVGLAITGAIGYLGAWISDAYIVSKKIEAQERAIAAGGDPTKVTAAIFSSGQTMFGFGAAGTLGLLALAGFAFYSWQKAR